MWWGEVLLGLAFLLTCTLVVPVWGFFLTLFCE